MFYRPGLVVPAMFATDLIFPNVMTNRVGKNKWQVPELKIRSTGDIFMMNSI